MPKVKITQTVVERYEDKDNWPAKRLELFDVECPWLLFRVTPQGARSYCVRARIRGQKDPITYTLGDAKMFKNPSEARAKCREVLYEMRRGLDPRIQRREQIEVARAAEQNKFDIIARRYIDEVVKKTKDARSGERLINRHLVGAWGSRQIAGIAEPDVSRL